MSAKHQENDTPVKASHLLLVIAVCQVLVPEHCLLGEPPKHEKFVSFHKSSVEWWPFVTYPAPRAAPPLFKKERDQKEKDQSKSFPPMTAPSAAAGRGQRVLDPGPTLPQRRSQVGVHVVLPQGSIASFQNFWNQGQFMKIRREIYSQSRIKALRIRMRQLISPLIVISTWMGRS